MLRKANLVVAMLIILAFANASLASVYQTVDISTGIDVGTSGNPFFTTRDTYWTVLFSARRRFSTEHRVLDSDDGDRLEHYSGNPANLW